MWRIAMQDKLSASQETEPLPVLRLARRRLLAMVLMGYIPLLHVSVVILVLILPLFGVTPIWTVSLAPALLYLLPPVVVRATLAWRPLFDGRYDLHSPEFLVWWFTGQWQIVFNRLPFLEELLRLVPGLYSTWLRLWGAHIGKLVYWSPGVVVLDRPFLAVGSQAVFGIAARAHAHLICRGSRRDAMLLLGQIRVGQESLIGGLSLLLPGVHIHGGEELRGARPTAPFTEYKEGRCTRYKEWLVPDELPTPVGESSHELSESNA
jgi:hypothetical protein